MNYFSKIENKHRKVTINEKPEYSSEKLCLLRYLESFPDGEFSERIKEMIGNMNSTDYFDKVRDRENEIKGLLYSAWKMCYKGKDGKEVAVRYIFPYKYSDANEYLFYLEVPMYSNFYHINGLVESSADINNDNTWTRMAYTFYEVDFSEMVEYAKIKCEEVAIVRLTKLIERDKVIK